MADALGSRQDSPPAPLRHHESGTTPQRFFGIGLRQLRETRAVTAEALVSALSLHGHAVTFEDYVSVESGAVLPVHAARFLHAYAASLDLTPSEKHDLEERLAHDILRARLGERAKKKLVPRPHWSA